MTVDPREPVTNSGREHDAASGREFVTACIAECEGVESGQEANRPGDATNAPGHDTEVGASMPDKRTTSLRPMSSDGLSKLTESELRERIARAFARMGDFQRGTSRGYRRAEAIRNECWAEVDRRGLPRLAR